MAPEPSESRIVRRRPAKLVHWSGVSTRLVSFMTGDSTWSIKDYKTLALQASCGCCDESTVSRRWRRRAEICRAKDYIQLAEGQVPMSRHHGREMLTSWNEPLEQVRLLYNTHTHLVAVRWACVLPCGLASELRMPACICTVKVSHPHFSRCCHLQANFLKLQDASM